MNRSRKPHSEFPNDMHRTLSVVYGAEVAYALKCRRRFLRWWSEHPRSVPFQGGLRFCLPAPCPLLWCGARGGGCGALRTAERGLKLKNGEAVFAVVPLRLFFSSSFGVGGCSSWGAVVFLAWVAWRVAGRGAPPLPALRCAPWVLARRDAGGRSAAAPSPAFRGAVVVGVPPCCGVLVRCLSFRCSLHFAAFRCGVCGHE